MRLISKKVILLLSSIVILPLAGCFNSDTPEDKIYNILEDVAKEENDFKDKQEPLKKLEEKDNKLYEKIIDLGMKEYKSIVSLSEDAIKGINDRKELIKAEKASIDESKKEFVKLDKEIKNLKERSLQTKAADLQNIMDKRYAKYDELYKNYMASLKTEKELYTLFKDKKLTMEELETKVESVNDVYDDLMKSNKEFNKLTEHYNQKKLSFYQDAGIEVKAK